MVWYRNFFLCFFLIIPSRALFRGHVERNFVKEFSYMFYKGICLHFLRISPYSARMRKNADQNNSEYGHVLRSFGNQDKIYFTISFVGALKMRYSSSKGKFPQNATVFHNFILTHEIYYRIIAFLYLLRYIF